MKTKINLYVVLCCLLLQTACSQTVTHRVVFDQDQIDQISVLTAGSTERIVELLKDIQIKAVLIPPPQEGQRIDWFKVVDVGANALGGVGHMAGWFRRGN